MSYQIGATTYYTCAETARFLRAVLKSTFPGITFSVRCDVSANTAGILIKYTGGPDAKAVEQATARFYGTYWHHEHECRYDRFETVDGVRVHYGANHIIIQRNTITDGSVQAHLSLPPRNG